MDERQRVHLKILSELIESPYTDVKFAKLLLPKLFDWNDIPEEFERMFERVFRTGNEDTLEMLLQSGIDIHISNKKGYDLVAYIFDNVNVDVIKLLGERKFNVDARDRHGEYALVKCARRHSAKDMKFLLCRGANVIKNINYDDPEICFLWDEDCSEVLARHALNAYFLFSTPFTGYFGSFDYFIRVRFTWCYIMILEGQGIRGNWNFYLYYDAWKDDIEMYREDVEWMKKQVLSETVTLFTVLTENSETIMHCVRNKEIVTKLLLNCKKRHLNTVYYRKLKKRLDLALEMNDLKRVAAEFIAESIQLFDPTHLVIEKVISYLNCEDLLAFADMRLTYRNRLSLNVMYSKKNN